MLVSADCENWGSTEKSPVNIIFIYEAKGENSNITFNNIYTELHIRTLFLIQLIKTYYGKLKHIKYFFLNQVHLSYKMYYATFMYNSVMFIMTNFSLQL